MEQFLHCCQYLSSSCSLGFSSELLLDEVQGSFGKQFFHGCFRKGWKIRIMMGFIILVFFSRRVEKTSFPFIREGLMVSSFEQWDFVNVSKTISSISVIGSLWEFYSSGTPAHYEEFSCDHSDESLVHHWFCIS